VTGQASSQLIWTVASNAPDSLFYQSELNSGMFGAISVTSELTTVAVITSSAATTSVAPGSSTAPPATTAGASSTTGAGPTAPATSGIATTATTTTTAGPSPTPTAAPTTAPCRMAVCCVLGSRPLPVGFSEFVLTINTTFATFNCPAYTALLLRDMQLSSPQQLVVLSVNPGSVLYGAAAPTAAVDSFMLLIQQGRQNPALLIVSAVGPKGPVTPPAQPCCPQPKKKRTVVNFYFDSILANNGTCSSCGGN